METIGKIRRLVLRGDRSIRSVSRETGLSRNTIKKYLKDASPPVYSRRKPSNDGRLSRFADRLQELYEQDSKRPRRERRTARKLYQQLALEGYEGSYSPVQRFVRALKQEGQGGGTGRAFIPLFFAAGDALQFDWSAEHVLLAGVEQIVHVAQFRLCHSRKRFVVAYPRESQEMVLDAFVRALTFYGAVPRRAIIDNPKTMVLHVARSKERVFHPRFLALMNHYVMEPVACTPAAGWEKGQVEKQVRDMRGESFTPKCTFEHIDALNIWLEEECERLADSPHPEQQDRTIKAVFAEELGCLGELGRAFDGYVEKTVHVRSTCLVQYDTNRYSAPSRFAGHPVSLRAYAGRIVLASGQDVIAEHKRHFTRNASYFEPWHYVPLLERKPGALRNGAPFVDWELPDAMRRIKDHYMGSKGGDREFVDLLLLAAKHGMETVEMACKQAVEKNTLRLSAIINLINHLEEPDLAPLDEADAYPRLTLRPEANCKRYETLYCGKDADE